MGFSGQRPPWWFICILVLCMLPLAAWPWVVGGMTGDMAADSTVHALVLAFPVYAVGSVYCAYRCFDGQTCLSWILVALLAAGYAALGMLVL